MFSLNTVINVLSTSALKSIYYPHFLYCLTVVKKNINSLNLKQIRCIRIIAKPRYNAHSKPLFYKLKILSFLNLVLHRKLSLMHSIAFSYATPFLWILPYLEQFCVPRCKHLFFNRFPLYSSTT